VGYRGKLAEQERARALRAEAWTLNEIAAELGVSKSSVSLWVRDVRFDEPARAARAVANRNRGAQSRRPSQLRREKEAEIERLLVEGRQRIGALSDRDLLIAGTALYAGEGTKTDGAVAFANSDPRMVILFCRWLRQFFVIDEARLRVYLYLHAGLDLNAARAFWSSTTGIPLSQFGKPYRAVPDPSIRRSKHPMGCPRVSYSCSSTHRRIMGLVEALLSSDVPSGVAQLAAAADC
jgi:transcriptional regulator with XRE-family HTH domain